MKWAFIDYENVGNLDSIDLAAYEKIIVFLGAKQAKLDFGEKKYDKLLNLVVIQIKATQANNLDFHLSYYLGKFDASADHKIAFEVISNDHGYEPLLSHITSNGRLCKIVKRNAVTQQTEKKVIQNPVLPTNEDKLIASLTARPKEKRPQKVVSLKNHIASHLQLKGNDIAIQNKLNYLVNQNAIRLKNGTDVEYLL